MRASLQVVMTRFGPCLTKSVSVLPDDCKNGSARLSGEDHAVKVKPHRKGQPPATVKPFTSIPGPQGLPFIGTLHHYFIKDGIKFDRLFEVQNQRASEYGDIYVEKLAGLRNVIISCPYEYNKVIHNEAKHPKKFMLDPLIYYKHRRGIKQGIITSEGDQWYKQRSLVSKKMLVLSEVAKFADQMGEVADDFVKRLEIIRDSDGEVPNLKTELLAWAMESLGVFLFKERLGCLSESPPPMVASILKHFEDMVLCLQHLMYGLPLYKMYHTKTYKEFERHSDVVFAVVSSFVDKVSTAITWNLYALAKNPRVQEEMCTEIREARGRAGGQLSAHEIVSLPYVKAVVKETMRAFPIIHTTSRFLPVDLELAGYHVPAGAHVQANLYGMYSNVEFFEKPEEFLPERWVKSSHQITNRVVKSIPLLTWGHGPRMCVGRRIAEQEMYLVLSKIVERFKLSYHHEAVGPTLTLVLTPDKPVRIRFTPRN
ncbi:cholesterol side-chain cleavage enzyme, mitochondrial [Elysia marginata]|uniref:Cholesterol side-chain cleavage enzyme, mitochondrial n=1 Tax=Elysia marginata TaxID=1093978 RepID=A0AAV4EVL1_9GAST|nr:cholesterol side-chain cleavage enzyme, mitochondrial [Elysia marginata]